MRIEPCLLCGSWIVVLASPTGMTWGDIARGIRHHNVTTRHRLARKAAGL